MAVAAAMMAMTVVWIAPLAQTSMVDPDLIAELLHRHAMPGDRLQHARVRDGPDGRLMIFGFLMADNHRQAETTLLQLIHRTLDAEPTLRLWRII